MSPIKLLGLALLRCSKGAQNCSRDGDVESQHLRVLQKMNTTGAGRQRVTCFKCKPACLKHFFFFRSSDIMLKLEEELACQTQTLSLVSVSKQIQRCLKQVKWSHPEGRFVFLFLFPQSNQNWIPPNDLILKHFAHTVSEWMTLLYRKSSGESNLPLG